MSDQEKNLKDEDLDKVSGGTGVERVARAGPTERSGEVNPSEVHDERISRGQPIP
jgi:hypothetical protein